MRTEIEDTDTTNIHRAGDERQRHSRLAYCVAYGIFASAIHGFPRPIDYRPFL